MTLFKASLPHIAVLFLVSVAGAQTWTQLNNPPWNEGFYPGNEMLLTDGTVLMQDADNEDWWRLTPDINGSYVNGTWTQLASTPGYGPLYYASQVLPNGNVMTIGGEYNDGSGGVWQNQGATYDPVTNIWTTLVAPAAWTSMGDTGSITLPNGNVLIADPLSNQCAIYNPLTNTIGNPFVNGKADPNDEEGLALLPDGSVLTVDAWDDYNTEVFNPKTMTWTTAGQTPVFLGDDNSREVGPIVLRYDGTVFCSGASGVTCIYNTKTHTWTQGPTYPTYEGTQLGCEDAPAVLLPNGNVLVQVSPETSDNPYQSPSFFFEFDGKKLTQVPNTTTAQYDDAFCGVFLMLPTGQVLTTDFTGNAEVYTCKGGPQAAWAPKITSYPTLVKPGQSYTISGTQFNGLSGDSAYGDDEQNETNYPIIRIINNKTHHVFYCREFDPSTMAICTGSSLVSTHFQVPSHLETGPSTIEVVTNGIPSVAKPLTVY